MIEIKCTQKEKEKIIWGMVVGSNEQGVCLYGKYWDCVKPEYDGDCRECLKDNIKWEIIEPESGKNEDTE